MHDMTSNDARRALMWYEVMPVKGGNIRENIPGVSCFRAAEPEGESCEFDRLGVCGGERTAYPESSCRSEQLSCTKFFHPSYGLFYINFRRFKSILGFI